MSSAATAPAQTATGENPYVGPRPFGPKECRRFFGRESEARELLSLIAAHSLVVLHSPSGAGKSSLLNTQVYPRTESAGEFPRFLLDALPITTVRRYLPRGFTEGEAEKSNIYAFNTKCGWMGDAGLQDAKAPLLKDTLAEFLVRNQEAWHPERRDGSRPWVVVIDQFEEIFTAYPHLWAQRAGFFDQLEQALNDKRLPDLRVVLSMREEYLGQLQPYAGSLPRQAQVRYRLERLTKTAALEAAIKPAKTQRCEFAEDAATQLVEALLQVRTTGESGKLIQTEGEFVEPVLLQVVCSGIWEKLGENKSRIGLEEVARFGDVNKALVGFYEDAIRAAANPTTSEQSLRSWCEHQLITPMQTRGMVLQGQAETAGIPNDTVKVLEDRRLIRAEQHGGTTWYELTHDTLIQPILDSNRAARFWGGIPGVFSGESLDQWLAFQAGSLKQYRKLRVYAGKTLDQLVEQIPDQPKDAQIAQDGARWLFASKVLDGTIHLARQVPQRGYSLLEGIWLQDVKDFVAYLLWENKGIGLDVHPEENYFQVSNNWRAMLERKENKPSSALAAQEFEQARVYLESKRLTPKGRDELTKVKAYWYWLAPAKSPGCSDWDLAKTFVSMFYDHIIPAVVKRTEDDTLMVLKALQYGEPHAGYLVVNALEAALAIYFLDPEVMTKLWSPGPGRDLSGRVSVRASWPLNFKVPAEIGDRIVLDRSSGELSCRGVMMQAQRNALLKQLDSQDTCEAVERLHRESRLLFRNRIF